MDNKTVEKLRQKAEDAEKLARELQEAKKLDTLLGDGHQRTWSISGPYIKGDVGSWAAQYEKQSIDIEIKDYKYSEKPKVNIEFKEEEAIEAYKAFKEVICGIVRKRYEDKKKEYDEF